MPFDGITVNSLVSELTIYTSWKVDKIYHPKDELVLRIRKDRDNNKLLISASPSFPRFNLS